MIRLKGGRLFDPANGVDGTVRDLYIDRGRIATAPGADVRIEREYDVTGKVVMAGAIDLHTHIGGGKVNLARAMLPEDHRDSAIERTALTRAGSGRALPSTSTAGYRYVEMGYTACFEPAILPVNARQAHMEMGDTPIVDKGGYAMLGNDDFLLRLMAQGAEQKTVNDYVAWTLHATQCIGIKVVNPGGISAFKFNQRRLDLDQPAPHYGVTPRAIVATLTRALHELGVPHPLHVHASNLGVPGNVDTTLATMDAAEGRPIHLTHIQFHSYGTEGERKFSSAAERIANAIDRHPNVSADVGQIMFGRTVTASGDTMAQYRNSALAQPKKWLCMDIECDAGCGVVPFRYRDASFVNALQWTIGLELFLRAKDPWRVLLTTDHPNGAPFTSYPHLIRLLMDRGFREQKLASIHPDAAAHSQLAGLTREYSLYEIAIMTRAAPARTLGLRDRGHLGAGAAADITIYPDLEDREAMFCAPEYVFKDGELIVHDGRIVRVTRGATHVVQPEFDRGIERALADFFGRYHTIAFENFPIPRAELLECGSRDAIVHACNRRENA
jgi:formylmethanofuran dehydrogenase subunit A